MKISKIFTSVLAGVFLFTGVFSSGGNTVEAASSKSKTPVLTKNEQRALFFSHLVYKEKKGTYNEQLSGYMLTSKKPKDKGLLIMKKEIESNLPKGVSFNSFYKSLDLDSYYSSDLIDEMSDKQKTQARNLGLSVKLYRSFNKNNPSFVAVAGTDQKIDLVEDLKIARGYQSVISKKNLSGYNVKSPIQGVLLSIRLAQDRLMIGKNESFYLVGHSLGGRISNIIGVPSKIKTITFSTPKYVGRDRIEMEYYVKNNKSYNPKKYHSNHYFVADPFAIPKGAIAGDNHVYLGTNHSVKGYYKFVK